MTGTPDLRTLAAEAFTAFTLGFDRANPWALPNDRAFAAMDAVLAAVLPAHRQQVLAEAAEVTGWFLSNDDLRRRERAAYERGRAAALAEAVDAIEHQPFDHKVNDGTHATGGYFRPQTVLDIVRRLASAAPETAPTPRQDDETAPAVPEQALPEGKTTVTDTLYAVHIEGPDDVIAAVDKSEAEEKAGEINAFAAEFAARPDSSELDPKFHANVIEWPYSADDHAEEVQRKDRWDL